MFLLLSADVCNEEGAVRLVDGANMYEGRLEICATQNSRREWGTVCGDGLTTSDEFDIDAARVVCRQLGIQESGELLSVHS